MFGTRHAAGKDHFCDAFSLQIHKQRPQLFKLMLVHGTGLIVCYAFQRDNQGIRYRARQLHGQAPPR